jgi:hypothetical protein
MAYANIQLQNQSIKIKTVPGSGLIQVLLPKNDHCFYNPASGLFSTAPVSVGGPLEPDTDHLPELKEKLNEFDSERRAYIARYNRFSAGLNGNSSLFEGAA